MAKFIFKHKILFVAILIIMIAIIARTGQKYFDSKYDGLRLPYMQMVGSDRATIKFQNIIAKKITLYYGTDKNNLSLHKQEKIVKKKHKIILNNLHADTKYYYKILDKIYNFNTAPLVNSKDLWFWVLGDAGKNNKNLNKVITAAYGFLQEKNQQQFNLILTTGDNAYRSGRNIEYQQAIFNTYQNTLSQINIWPAYGNHDERRDAFYDIFDFPTNGELGGIASGTESYYSFDYANIHFVFLNSEKIPILRTNKMVEWLATDLAANKLKWTVALFHSPPYTKGSHDSDSYRDSWGKMIYMREHVLPILEKFSVDLVLSGHSHSYERSHLIKGHYGKSASFSAKMIVNSGDNNIYNKKDTGTIYAVVGSSSKNDKETLNHKAMLIGINDIGSLILRISNNKLSAYFVNGNQQTLDAFSINK